MPQFETCSSINWVGHALITRVAMRADRYRHHVPVGGTGGEGPPKQMRYAIELSASDNDGLAWKPLSKPVSGPVGMWGILSPTSRDTVQCTLTTTDST